MGEYAEMMLDGTCCCSCGEFLGDGNGFPEFCASCQPDERPIFKVKKENVIKQKKTVSCTHSGCLKKFVDQNAVNQHLRQFHRKPNHDNKKI